MSLSSFPHQYRGSNAFKLKVRSLAGAIRTLLIRAGVEKNPGPLKCHCCSKTLGKNTKKAPTIWCHVCGRVHFKCSDLNSPADYEKSPNFRCTWCLENTRFAPKNYDPAFCALQRLYTTTNNPSAFGSGQSLRSAAATKRITGKQTDKFLSLSETYTKFRASKNNFTRLKVQSYRINEIWFGDLADVHQLAKDNDEKKFLLVFVDCLSRFLRVEPIDNKSAKQKTTAALEEMTRKQKPEKIGLTKEKSWKGNLQNFAWRKTIRCTVLIVSRSRVLRSAIFEPSNQYCSSTCMKTTPVSTLIKFKTLSSWSTHVPTKQPKLLQKILAGTIYLT